MVVRPFVWPAEPRAVFSCGHGADLYPYLPTHKSEPLLPCILFLTSNHSCPQSMTFSVGLTACYGDPWQGAFMAGSALARD